MKQLSEQEVGNDDVRKLSRDETFDPPQIPAQPKKRRWKKIVLITISVTALLIIATLSLPLFLNLLSKDIAPIDDSDLTLKVVTVPNNENAYFDLIKLKNVIYEPEESQIMLDMFAGKTWNDKVAEEVVSRNAQAFSYFAEAANKLRFQDPISADPAHITPNSVLPEMNSWRIMAHLSVIKALYLAKQGKDKEAMNEALNSVSIGQKIQESQVPLIEYLVAIAMKGVGLETIQKILITSKLSSDDMKQYVQGLDKYYRNEDGFINAFKVQYKMLLGSLDAIFSGNPEVLKEIVGEEGSGNPYTGKDNYYFQLNKTKLLFADYTRVNIKNANKSCGEIKASKILTLAPTNPAKQYIEENFIGERLHDVIAVSLAGVSTKKCEEDLLVSATQAQVAIKAYKDDTHTYPSSLNELIPAYLSALPEDPFDGKSLKYSVEKKIIYSVGEDTQDSGGSTGDDWRKMTDPTFEINF